MGQKLRSFRQSKFELSNQEKQGSKRPLCQMLRRVVSPHQCLAAEVLNYPSNFLSYKRRLVIPILLTRKLFSKNPARLGRRKQHFSLE